MDILIAGLAGLFTIPSLIGAFTMFHWFKPTGGLSDDSNVFGRMMSWWIGLTRSDKMAEIFPILRLDVWELFRAVIDGKDE